MVHGLCSEFPVPLDRLYNRPGLLVRKYDFNAGESIMIARILTLDELWPALTRIIMHSRATIIC